MSVNYIRLNRFYDLLDYPLIEENSFINFLSLMNLVFEELLVEIESNAKNSRREDFLKYYEEEIRILKRKSDNIPLVGEFKIKSHFRSYKLVYHRFSDLNKINSNSRLYLHLSEYCEKLMNMNVIQMCHDFQSDFLNYSKRFLIDRVQEKLVELKDSLHYGKGFPDEFKSFEDFESFKFYLKNFVQTPRADIGYLFRRMTSENKFNRNFKHNEFKIWLNDNNYITEGIFEQLIEKDGFDILNNLGGKGRPKRYNTAFALD